MRPSRNSKKHHVETTTPEKKRPSSSSSPSSTLTKRAKRLATSKTSLRYPNQDSFNDELENLSEDESVASFDTQEIIYDDEDEDEEISDIELRDEDGNDGVERDFQSKGTLGFETSSFDSLMTFEESSTGHLKFQKDVITKHMLRAFKSRTFKLWMTAEWGFSDIDRGIFDYWLDLEWSRREDLLMEHEKESSRLHETSFRRLVRKALKCRRFSKAFIHREKILWEQFRELYRYLQFSQGQCTSKIIVDLGLGDRFPSDVPHPFVIYQRVTVMLPYEKILKNDEILHPYSLVTGIVIAVNPLDNCYKIRFDREELGVEYIADSNIMGHGPDLRIPCVKSMSTSLKSEHRGEEELVSRKTLPFNDTHKTFDLRHSKSTYERSIQDQSIPKGVIYILSGMKDKAKLITSLNEMNQYAQRCMAIEGKSHDGFECHSLDISFRREYTRVLSQMKELDAAILRTLILIKSKLRHEMSMIGPITDENPLAARKDVFHNAKLITDEQKTEVLAAREERDRLLGTHRSFELSQEQLDDRDSARHSIQGLIQYCIALMTSCEYYSDTSASPIETLIQIDASMALIRSKISLENQELFRTLEDLVETLKKYMLGGSVFV